MRSLIVIPARMGATRFPGKVLKPLGRFPIVEWCRRAALRAAAGRVVVATEDEEVARAVERHGGQAVMTGPCRTGTDRVHSALRIMERKTGLRFGAIVNVQGDEPFIRPSTIRAVGRLAQRRGVDVSTAVVPLRPAELRDPNAVKAAVAADGRCLYFSRSPIPFRNGARSLKGGPFFRHIGIYGFARAALKRFVRLEPSPLEGVERLEQLRALEAGMTVFAARVSDRTLAIDTPADLRRAKRRLGSRNG